MSLSIKRYQETGTQALRRALTILNTFSQGTPELSVTEISKSLSLPKGTVHRLLSCLKFHNFIEQDEYNSRYRLGWRIFELGSCVDALNLLKRKARPYLEELCEKSKETVHLAVLQEGDILYIDKIMGLYKMTMITSVGLRLPSHVGGLGKALLAFLPETDLEKIIDGKELKKFTKNTIVDPNRLKEVLKKVKQNGYAIDHEEVEIGLTCVGVPIKDFTSKVVAAVSISGPTLRMSKEVMAQSIRLAVDTGKKISNVLGFENDSQGRLK